MEGRDRTTVILVIHANASAMGTFVERTTRVQLMHNEQPREVITWRSPAHALHQLFGQVVNAS